MRRVTKNWLIILTPILLIISSLLFLASLLPDVPLQEVKRAREALYKAEIARSRNFAKRRFDLAKKLYDSTLYEWRRVNNTFLLKRDYSKVKFFALESYKASKEAKILAEANSKDISLHLKKKIDAINLFIKKYDNLFKDLPLTSDTRKIYQNAMMAFSESKIAYDINDLSLATKKIALAEDKISKVKSATAVLLNDYTINHNKWKKWVDSTINISKNNDTTVIIVDKFRKKCFLYDKGILKYTFDVELGKNWIGNKKIRNDKATPEGMYFIEKKIDGNKTKYYKALVINYPNAEDTIRFNTEKSKGRILSSADIGNMIEFHGGGGQGTNWTNGCIALTNEEIDTIFNLVNAGTPVTIVGSLIKLRDIIDF
jgi:lipoprotein-anchoring transpeptidase ErfK/SrfK